MPVLQCLRKRTWKTRFIRWFRGEKRHELDNASSVMPSSRAATERGLWASDTEWVKWLYKSLSLVVPGLCLRCFCFVSCVCLIFMRATVHLWSTAVSCVFSCFYGLPIVVAARMSGIMRPEQKSNNGFDIEFIVQKIAILKPDDNYRAKGGHFLHYLFISISIYSFCVFTLA